jgi:serine/threonine protein kinase
MTRCGSILWMAPEIISGDTFNEKIDVYSCHLRGPRRAHHRQNTGLTEDVLRFAIPIPIRVRGGIMGLVTRRTD